MPKGSHYASAYLPDLAPVSRDRAAVLRAIAGMTPLRQHSYLEVDRCLPRALLTAPRFAGRILVDHRGNAVFPHADRDGPCGFEVKNRGFTGFPRGGEKALWFSGARRTDTALVLAESAIDALSHAVLFPNQDARYASFAGGMNPTQPGLIAAAVARLNPHSTVYLALDNDPGGIAFACAGADAEAVTLSAASGVVEAIHRAALIARLLGEAMHRETLPAARPTP